MTSFSLNIEETHHGYCVTVHDGAGQVCEDTSKHLLRALVEAAFAIAYICADDNPPVLRGGHP
jgi:hypothetical protein